MVFFGVLEIYSREFSPQKGWKCDGSLAFFAQKLHVSVSKFKKIISKIYKWDVLITGNRVVIFIPKFTTLLDESTQRKFGNYRESIGSQSGVTPKISGTDKDKDKDKEANIILSSKQPVDNFSDDDIDPADFNPPKEAPLKKPKEEKPEDQNGDLRNLINQVKVKHPKLAIDSWYGKNMRAHPEAILHVLRSLLKADEIENGIAYIQKALEIENGKYNARDEEAAHEIRKRPRGDDAEMLGKILNRAMAAQPP
jgi:hypothetical protein